LAFALLLLFAFVSLPPQALIKNDSASKLAIAISLRFFFTFSFSLYIGSVNIGNAPDVASGSFEVRLWLLLFAGG
jgi:hypothetical protein